MSKRSRRVLEELSSVSEAKLLLQAAVDRRTFARLQKEAEEIVKYFDDLTANNILDITISSKDSQIEGVEEADLKLLRSNNAIDNVNIQKLSKNFKSIYNGSKLVSALNSCENYKPNTLMENIVVRIYVFVLRIHHEKPWYFSSENLKRYPEFDFQMKFWGYMFETYLGRNRHIVLQWGDTMSNTCKKVGLRFKLDLRLLILKDDESISDGATGEVARKATKRKFYNDRLKSVLASKCHLNAFLESLLHISEEEIVNVVFPLVQIMGLEARISSLRLTGKKKYVVEDLYSFNFPRTLGQIKAGDLESLINGFALIEDKNEKDTSQDDTYDDDTCDNDTCDDNTCDNDTCDNNSNDNDPNDNDSSDDDSSEDDSSDNNGTNEEDNDQQ
ncbi:hypothetical protein MFLAVUS_002289 [Mucor flavus]|uniref:Uncharacterized protein n=1 Tax=Mucor flavus TaxID=439312 RepID=A0ABP9YPW5_9FUNG